MAEDREKFDAALGAARRRAAAGPSRADVSAKRARSRANSGSRCSCGRRTCWAAAAWRSSTTRASSRRTSRVGAAHPRPARRCSSTSTLRGLEVEVDAVFDGEDILHSGDLRARRTRRHPLRRFDQRLSAADHRRRDGAAHRRRHAAPSRANSASAGSSTSSSSSTMANCTSSKPTRARAARCRSSPKATGDQPRRRRDARRARREAARHGVRHGALAAARFRGRQSSGVLVRQDARRRNDPRPGDEIDRRSARHRRDVCRRAAAKASSAPASRCPATGGRILRLHRRRGEGSAPLPSRGRSPTWISRSSRRPAPAQRLHASRHRRQSRQQDRRGIAPRPRSHHRIMASIW